MTRNYSRDLRPHRHESATVKLWQRYQGKPCRHPRTYLWCKHCIAAARIEAHWNRRESAS